MEPDIEELRRQYIENPPEGMTSTDIRHMSEDEFVMPASVRALFNRTPKAVFPIK